METAAVWLAARPEEVCRRAAAAMRCERPARPIAPVASTTASRDLATLVADPKAVDWQRFAGRFGETGKLFLALLPAAAQR